MSLRLGITYQSQHFGSPEDQQVIPQHLPYSNHRWLTYWLSTKGCPDWSPGAIARQGAVQGVKYPPLGEGLSSGPQDWPSFCLVLMLLVPYLDSWEILWVLSHLLFSMVSAFRKFLVWVLFLGDHSNFQGDILAAGQSQHCEWQCIASHIGRRLLGDLRQTLFPTQFNPKAGF